MSLMVIARVAGAAPRVLRRARRAARSPTCPRTRRRARSRRSAVIGAGTMGGGIAMNFLNAGIPVTLLETKQEALDKRRSRTIRKNYEGTVEEGQAHAPRRSSSAWRCSSPRSPTTTSKDADLVIEAVFEDMGVKEAGVPQARRGRASPARSSPPTPRRSTSTGSPASPSARRTWSACTSSARPT